MAFPRVPGPGVKAMLPRGPCRREPRRRGWAETCAKPTTVRPDLAWSLLAPFEGAAQLVGKRSDPLRRGVLMFGVLRIAGPRRTFRNQRDADPLLLEVDARNLERPGHARRERRGPFRRSSRRTERRDVRQCLDAGLELDERAELRDARDAAGPHLPDLVRGPDVRPGIGGELLQPEGDLLPGLVRPEDPDRDLTPRPSTPRGVGPPRPPPLR